MRNLFFAIFSLLALTFLGVVAVHWESRVTQAGQNSNQLSGAAVSLFLLPVSAVAVQEVSGQDDERDADDSGESQPGAGGEQPGSVNEDDTDNSDPSNLSAPGTNVPQVASEARHGRQPHKTIRVDLSDLVVRPV